MKKLCLVNEVYNSKKGSRMLITIPFEDILDKKLKEFGVIPIYLNGCLEHGEYNENDISGYVDHAECFYEIWDALVKNDDIFMNFIFGFDTAIYLSTDNSDVSTDEDENNFPLKQYYEKEGEYVYCEKWN